MSFSWVQIIYLPIFLVSVLILSVLFIDCIFIFIKWQSRIFIGIFINQMQWRDKVLKVGLKWLRNPPKVKLTDDTKLAIIDIIKRNYSQSVQYWQEGALLLGIGEYIRKNEFSYVNKQITKLLSLKFDKCGNWIKSPSSIEAAFLAYAVMNLKFFDTGKYRAAFDVIWSLINDNLGEDGTVYYRKHLKNYRFVDTIGMICPFLALYGTKFNNQDCINLAIKQINNFNKYGILDGQGIPFHGYSTDFKTSVGLLGWGRGVAWYAIGLADTWILLPDNNYEKKIMEERIIKLVKVIIKFQHESGYWSWILNIKETKADSSVTAALAWFLKLSSIVPEIKNQCLEGYAKAVKFLVSVTRRSGEVDFSQGDTKGFGIYSQLFDILPFTQGFVIRSIVELSK